MSGTGPVSSWGRRPDAPPGQPSAPEALPTIAERLGVGRGVTALIGGGGKTTLMYALAAELAQQGSVIVTTTTKIYPPTHLPVANPSTPEALGAALAAHSPLCLGTPLPPCRGAQCAPADPAPAPEKLSAPTLPIHALAEAADYVLVEADGAKGLPAKAHADHEPVLPPEARTVILVLGAEAFGQPIRAVCHRPERCAALVGTSPDALLTPTLAARLILAEGYGNIIYVNKCESEAAYRNAEALSRLLPLPVVAGSLIHKNEVMMKQQLILIRGAGDLASGIALRLWRAGFAVVMTDLPQPTTIRRTVAFSQVMFDGETVVEDVRARRAADAAEALALLARGVLPVLADPDCRCREALGPAVLVDAILAKRNLGTAITDAPVVIGVGPGFTAGVDCHAAVETMRGHTLGRVLYAGSPLPNTNVPGLIGGFAGERVLRAPAEGVFREALRIGDRVRAGDVAGWVGDAPMVCTLDGVLRGLLATGVPVHKGMKAGDVDPRGDPAYCRIASDKALAIGGGVLEAILCLRSRR